MTSRLTDGGKKNNKAILFVSFRFESEQDDSILHVSHNVTAFEFLYEPFYVALDTAPPHDERFVGYGYTRNTQVYEMFLRGWKFQVLSPSFGVHLGLQVRKSRPGWRERQAARNAGQIPAFKREAIVRAGKALPVDLQEPPKPKKEPFSINVNRL